MRDDFFVNSIIVLQEKATSTWGIHQIRDHPHVSDFMRFSGHVLGLQLIFSVFPTAKM